MKSTGEHTDLTGTRVIAAMSGGVDSSVTALVLRDRGAEVMGATMQLYHNEDLVLGESVEGGSTCCSLDDVEDAKDVCRRLGLRHVVLNRSADFAAKVMDPFCESYLKGETPNPCIECNRHLKFTSLQLFRAQMGYDYIATGHYVRRRFNESTGRYELLRARDLSKDQSYVLYSMTQDQLAHTLFPLGELTKPEVREMAAGAGFINAEKGESQDICFVPDGDYLSFIRNRTGCDLEPGEIVDTQGNVLGRHLGLAGYTIGQRKGIGVASTHPYYVCGKDLERNRLIIGSREETFARRVMVRNLTMVAIPSIEESLEVQVKLSYRQEPRDATATRVGDDLVELVFREPVRATASGQAAVFYQGDLVIGGGVIDSCHP